MNPTTTTTPASAGKLDRLAAHASQAAALRAWQTHPDVIALRVERVRTQVDVLLWAGIVAGLAFTMVNVQQFAAAGAPAWSLGWCAAWLLDPMVSLVLLAILRAEQITARYQVALPAWAQRTKWLTFAACYVMNTWTAWGLGGQPFSAASVVLHSVPPLVVFFTAETGPGLRDRLTEAVHRALTEAAARQPTNPATTVHQSPLPMVHEPAQPPVHDPFPNAAGSTVRERRPTGSHSGKRGGSRTRRPARRRLFADYLADAQAQLTPDIEVSPAWCRRVTGCSAGTSVKLAAALRNHHQPTPASTATTAAPGTDRHSVATAREAA